jgi:hypothetical protein
MSPTIWSSPRAAPCDLAHRFTLGRAVDQILVEHLGVQADGPQRVADLVGDASRHLTQRRQPA